MSKNNSDGMSLNLVPLRDYFAGQALAGMLADHRSDPTLQEAAEYAYAVADAMIAARKATVE